MGCRERPFRIEKGPGCGPYRILWLWLMGFERMRMRSSLKGQAEARSRACTAMVDTCIGKARLKVTAQLMNSCFVDQLFCVFPNLI